MSEKIVPTASAQIEKTQNAQAFLQLMRRLHFTIGLFIGPFIFVAALTGTLYVLTPQLENYLYAQQLTTDAPGPAQPLSKQVEAALRYAGSNAKIAAVRPAPGDTETTRVMFRFADSAPSETRALFIDPKTLAVRGDLTVYGTSGILPLRTTLDYLHRSLLLGDIGRNYSELAASWLWVAALGGVLLWAVQRTPRRAKAASASRTQRILRLRSWHSLLGVALLIGLLFLSATGLTWSRWAGDNINALRAHYGWLTPAVNTQLDNGMPPMMLDEHAEHHAHMMRHAPDTPLSAAQFDGVLAAARASGIDAAKLEIRPSYQANRAWIVGEIDRRWPTQVDSVAVNPHTWRVTDKVEFANFGLLAKLTRWGVDAHMGILFGVANQLVLALFGLALCVLIVLGYRLWWQRRPAQPRHSPAETLIQAWQRMSLSLRFLLSVVLIALAFSLPVMGISLVLFLLLDAWRWYRAQRA
ncbi:PepSY-associated TM helix domain-containing protein [Mixta theicola]|uniref:PepSY-associated TM helix domain-containing protein n=1 Tax=Mixta theicola TaxID=1458355 RepID=UPI00235C82FC|nr:PepSY-associated TM helix domain-containing protein [Mixta theicola]GLR08514.1 membrane protein [Mixta theicola]